MSELLSVISISTKVFDTVLDKTSIVTFLGFLLNSSLSVGAPISFSSATFTPSGIYELVLLFVFVFFSLLLSRITTTPIISITITATKTFLLFLLINSRFFYLYVS